MAYITFARWGIHWRLTCLICDLDTDCFHLTYGGKIYYFDYRRSWLPPKHPFRMQNDSFRKDTIMKKVPPKRLNGTEIANNLEKLVLNKEGNEYQGFGVHHKWTHICGMWELPYAKTLILMHNIDVMHQEYNFVESIISTCMDITSKRKDNVKTRRNLVEICNRQIVELTKSGGKPRALFSLKFKDRKEVLR
jgi:hypothetical protein